MPKTTRRTFLRASTAAAAAGWNFSYPSLAETMASASSAQPIVRLETDPKRALIPVLSWDTEGGERAGANLLRSPGIGLRVLIDSLWRDGANLPTTVQVRDGGAHYLLEAGRQSVLHWDIAAAKDSFRMTLSAEGRSPLPPGSVEMVFPFDLRFTSTTVLPSLWRNDGRVQAPMVISAPDFGQMLMEITPATELTGRFVGSLIPVPFVNLALELPPLGPGREYTLNFTPVILDPPAGLQDEQMWRQARRAWFNGFQPSAAVGDANDVHHRNAPPGLLTSKDLDGPCTFALYLYADLMLWTPIVAKGVSIANLVRQSIEFFLEKRTLLSGEVVGYTDQPRFLDSNPSILICAWDYVEATGDLGWLEKTIGQLEFVGCFTALQDQDGDGMVEASQSGNAGTLWINNRSSNWFDAMNYGHKDGYSNALIYRGWRCLADLEARLHRETQGAYYTQLAQRLKAAYAGALLNPKTGWLACWRSADGELHDYASPVVNGMAVEYALVGHEQARRIVDNLWAKMDAVGFNRFDLGVPTTLEPVHRSDYLQPDSFGIPKREDGMDTFQHYQNGGIFAGFSSPFVLANYRLGNNRKADSVLKAMLGREQKGGFQNGVHDAYPTGGEWTTWDGAPCGYEGYLADNYFFLRAVLLREPGFRSRYYKPLLAAGTEL